jgi:hypothetical protein
MLNQYATRIKSVCEKTGDILTFSGPKVLAKTLTDAQDLIKRKYGYLKIEALYSGKLDLTNVIS